MSNKNFVSKDNKIKLVNELDDERMNNNMKKFNFILEDANSIKKKTKNVTQNESQIKEIKKKEKTILGDQKDYYTGIKSKEDPSIYKFDKEENNFDKDIISNISEEDEDNLRKESISNARDTDVNFFEVRTDQTKNISDKDVKKEKLNTLMRDSLFNMHEMKIEKVSNDFRNIPIINIENEKNLSDTSLKLEGNLININSGFEKKLISSLSPKDKDILILNENKKVDNNTLDINDENDYLNETNKESQFSKNARNIINNTNKIDDNVKSSRASKNQINLDLVENTIQKDNFDKFNITNNKKNQIIKPKDNEEENSLPNHDLKNKMSQKSMKNEKLNDELKLNKSGNKDSHSINNESTLGKNNLNVVKANDKRYSKDNINEENSDKNHFDNIIINNDLNEDFLNLKNIEDENEKLIKHQSHFIMNNNHKVNLNNEERLILSNNTSREDIKDSIKYIDNDSKTELKKEEFFDYTDTKNYIKGNHLF